MSTIVSIGVLVNPKLNGVCTGFGLKNSGDSVTITAIPNKGRYFTYWNLPSGGVSTSNPLTFTASVNATYEANFENLMSVKVVQTGGGVATGQNLAAKKTDTITLVATPTSGYSFLGFFENGNLISTASTYAFITSSDRVIEPRFYQAQTGTNITTATPSLNTLVTAQAVTASWVEAGEIKTSGVRRAVFYVDVVHTDSANVRLKFLAKKTSGGTGYSFVPYVAAAGVVLIDGEYFELNTDATQSVMVELDLNEDVAFLGVNIEAGTVGVTADTISISYACHQ
jgi:hypothetical protein